MQKLSPVLILLPGLAMHAALANALPPVSLDLEQTTVSGLSSGGYMATQFHLANSDWVSGAGLIGTGPYYCARGDIAVALNQCVSKTESPIGLDSLMAQTQAYATEGLLPALSNLKDDKVWILHGLNDKTVNRDAADKLVAQYQSWVDANNLVYVNDQPFGHHFPTEQQGTDCAVSESPFIGSCNYDAAGEMLAHLLGTLAPKSTQPAGRLHAFDQQALGGDEAKGLGETGYAYVPATCENQQCKVHISFHGCNQYADAVGTEYATNTGLNQWADTNSIVVLYPQTKKSMFLPLNPQGCWDWWGYTGDNYATKGAVQIQAVVNMVNNINTGFAAAE